MGWRPEHTVAVRGQLNYRGGITVRTQDAHPARTAWLVVAGLLAFMLLLAGCGSSERQQLAAAKS